MRRILGRDYRRSLRGLGSSFAAFSAGCAGRMNSRCNGRTISQRPGEVGFQGRIVEQTDAWSEDTELSPEEQQLRLFEGVSALVSDLCQMQPVVMFLDDLHLSPQMSIQLHIARRLREYRLIIVYAFREDELIEHPVLPPGRDARSVPDWSPTCACHL